MQDPDSARWLAPDRLVPLDDQIRRWAREVVSEARAETSLDQARAIYNHVVATVKCSCGTTFQTRSTRPEIHVEMCSACHPFYTGKQKLVDTGGRVERFQRRYGRAPVQQ